MVPVEPLIEELPSFPDPWEIARQLAGLPSLLFLDSALPHPERGRYSFVTADPISRLIHRVDSEKARDPFAEIDRELRAYRTTTVPGLPPFQGGVAGMFGYGLNRHLENIPRFARDDFAVPDLVVGWYDWVISFDHLQQRAWLVSTGYPHRDPMPQRRAAAERMHRVRQWLQSGTSPRASTVERLAPTQIAPTFHLPGKPNVGSNFDRSTYLEVVRRAVEYVHEGDCFQVNIAQRLLSAVQGEPLALYDRLRTRNAAPFAGYFDMGEFTLLSASPERFIRVEDRHVETRPIKGTRPRGRTPEEEEANRNSLACSEKDRAENVMIVDLLRNDLGRVCEYGSVRVPSVCEVETFRYVHHLVSAVVGTLRRECSTVDLLRASFPGGSVTGAPKVRAMEIIAELEPTARGPYCGCLGYLGFNGTMDTNILIRTFTHGKGWLQFPVGGGIVAESDPIREYEETLHKAEGLLRALE